MSCQPELPKRGEKLSGQLPGKKGSSKQKIYETAITLRRYGEIQLGPGFSLKLKVEFEDGSTEGGNGTARAAGTASILRNR